MLSAGRLTAVGAPHIEDGDSSAQNKPSSVLSREERATRVSGGTGTTLFCPAKGSLSIPLKKLDAAPFGFPGRMETVIKRILRP